MTDYQAPLRDMNFLLNEVFTAERVWASIPALEEVNSELSDAILGEGAKLTAELIAPLNRAGDETGVTWQDGVVRTPEGFKDAYQKYSENGWGSLSGDPDYEGQGLPKMITILFEEMMCASNMAFSTYTALTAGACLLLKEHASAEHKQRYLPNMYSGVWAGAMDLTEPHCGTDLGLIRTRAVPMDDGSYELTGTKIFITGGEHDLAENIIHLVLAKLPDAPAGSRGISLFLVPKVNVNEDGSLAERNKFSCGSIEHKMGIHGSATCVMNFDGATGYLVGEENKGLAAMFTMMNCERLSSGVQGTGSAERSYQTAVAYAKDRLQGRAATGPQNKDKAADPILVHPDVRRMLLTMRATTEASRALSVYAAQYLDLSTYAEDPEQRSQAEQLTSLLTPIVKAFCTDMGLEATLHGQMILGGHGYIREWGQEQLVRDVRIAQIWEGTNGIQALALLGRNIAANVGASFKLFVADVEEFIAQHQDPEQQAFVKPLEDSLALLVELTQWVMQQVSDDPDAIGAASMEYLHVFGYTLHMYMWSRMALVAQAKKEQSQESDPFYDAKLHTAHFYIKRVLPRIQGLAASIKGGSEPMMAMPEELF